MYISKLIKPTGIKVSRIASGVPVGGDLESVSYTHLDVYKRQVYSVSIIPTGSAGGYTMPLPEKDEMFNTKGKMLQDITVALGGRDVYKRQLDR